MDKDASMENDDCDAISKHMRNWNNPGEEPAPKKGKTGSRRTGERVSFLPPPVDPPEDDTDPAKKEAKATKQ